MNFKLACVCYMDGKLIPHMLCRTANITVGKMNTRITFIVLLGFGLTLIAVSMSFIEKIKWKHIHARMMDAFDNYQESVDNTLRKVAATNVYTTVVTSNTVAPSFENMYAVIGMVKPDFRKKLSEDYCWMYAFYLPLTLQAWWRHNISSIVVIAGVNVSESMWTQHDYFQEMYRLIKDIPGVKFVYLESPLNLQVMIAQTSRLFACFLLPELPEDRILITSDIDIVPLSVNLYEHMQTDKVRILNANCCKKFRYGEKKYKMYPMTNIAATVRIWRTVMAKHNVKTAADIIQALAVYYKTPNWIQKGGNDGWYMDQHVVSIILKESNVSLDLVGRSMVTRIQRISGFKAWSNFSDFDIKADAHMLLPPWKFPIRITNLVHELFKNNKTLVNEFDRYTDMLFHD